MWFYSNYLIFVFRNISLLDNGNIVCRNVAKELIKFEKSISLFIFVILKIQNYQHA